MPLTLKSLTQDCKDQCQKHSAMKYTVNKIKTSYLFLNPLDVGFETILLFMVTGYFYAIS